MRSSYKSIHPNFYGQPFYARGEGGSSTRSSFPELGEFDHPVTAFHQDEAADFTPLGSIFSSKPGNVILPCNTPHYPSLDSSIGGLRARFASGSGSLDAEQFVLQKSAVMDTTLLHGHIEHWGDSGMADNSQNTDTSTDIDTDDKNQMPGVQQGAAVASDLDQHKTKAGDQKTLRRLAQNREAARKSRLRKKAYVQQLENSRLRLTQLEQELQRPRQQGCFSMQGDLGHSVTGNGALAFNLEYSRWLEEHQRLINGLRSAVNTHRSDDELCLLVDSVMAHYDELFKLKSVAAKIDVFHMLSGLWKSPAERLFMWLGGFRSSELLKILGHHLEPLTDQQVVGLCSLQQSSQQAEDALSQGMEALQQSLLDTLSSSSSLSSSAANVAEYMGEMAIAMSKLSTIENFLHQADLLRQQTLHQMHRILTTRQSARAFLVVSDYTSRLRALSSLWLARPRE